MDRIDVKVGFQCNNSCLFCVQAHKKGTGKDKSTEQIISILEEAAAAYQAVVFTGGEVTIRPDVVELVAAAKRLGFKKIHIQSNGRRFYYKSFCREIISAGANEFGFALHGHRPDLHDYLTRAPGSFIETLKSIRNISELGQPVLTNTVITKPSYRHLPDIARVLISAGVSQYQLAFVHILGNAGKYSLSVVPRKTLVKPYALAALDVGIANNVRCMTEAIPFCFLQGYEMYAAENIIPETKIYDADVIIESFTESRLLFGKEKGPQCARCAAFGFCEGPWKEYPEMFGWSEFKPLARFSPESWNAAASAPRLLKEKMGAAGRT